MRRSYLHFRSAAAALAAVALADETACATRSETAPHEARPAVARDSAPEESPIDAAAAIERAGDAAEEAGDIERAQSEFARAAARNPSSATAWLGFGRTSWRLFSLSLEDRSKGNPLLHVQDASRGFRRATEVDPNLVRAWIGASETARELGETADAVRFAETAHARLGPAATAALRYDAALELGRARAAALAAGSGTQNGAADALAAGAQTALVEAAHTRPDSIDPLLELAAMSAGRGEVAAACAFLDEAVSVAPDDARGHQRLRDVCVNAKDPARLRAIYDLLESRHPDSATVRWFGGFARLYEADERRRARAFDDADRGYDAALGSLERSRELNPAFVNAKQLEALALAGKARILFDKGETGDAVDVLTEAIEREPKALDATDALGISPKRTSLEIGGAYFEAGDLERGAAAFERWIAVVPDDVDWRNNAGLSLRDLGESLERRDQRDRAHECFERSFEHYRHVAELRPDEPRLVNDAALILLYHLHRDLDAAEEMFRRAIRLGEDKLAELGGERPETSDDDPASLGAARVYDYFAEATGDACQNLGLLLQQRSGDAAEIRALWRRALELDPRGTRGRIRGWIDSLPMSGPVSRPALIPR